MFILVVELETDQARAEELEAVVRALVASAEHEPGIRLYAAQRPEGQVGRFILYEHYEDKAAWEAHLKHPPARAQLDRFDALLTSPPKVTTCDLVATTPIG